MRSIRTLRNLLPIPSLDYKGEFNENESWDDDLSIKEQILINRDLGCDAFFHDIPLEAKEELILLYLKPELIDLKHAEIFGSSSQLEFDFMEGNTNEETRH